eukprot:CAMPEP_0176204918 /NCGR_PEP_ID=MMETSP0121_2-20121125/11331_1 /TAXON_ID=160619 /ORGANISM="Kryptoperidinium foliaceum, Strain CCMP 1326" /LENGTH=35 /DNA_ID= /DNA_START= /DNA_END= /DNA_ORIENTATION=
MTAAQNRRRGSGGTCASGAGMAGGATARETPRADA